MQPWTMWSLADKQMVERRRHSAAQCRERRDAPRLVERASVWAGCWMVRVGSRLARLGSRLASLGSRLACLGSHLARPGVVLGARTGD